MMKKYLALALIAPLLVSCSSSNKKGDGYNEAWVKDTNGFDILMGQFAHNIENIWGYNEVLLAGPKDYVKYTDQYQTRSHINFDEGTITTPFDMRVQNDIDRFHLVKDVLLRLPQLGNRGAYLYQKMSDKLVQHQQYINEYGEDMPEVREWKWK